MEKNLERLPPLEDHNAWADYWRYVIGLNVIPAKSKEKATYITWKQSGYQDNPISEEQHNEWKRTNAFANGMAVICDNVWFGEHAGKHFNCIDCDNKKAIEEFCTKDGNTKSLEETSKIFLVEQHLDNVNKCHIYFYSMIPLIAKSSSVNTVGKDKIENNEVPAYEIKSKSNTIAFCTPSFHQGGYQYEFIGTCSIPITLNERQSHELMQHLDRVHKKYGMQYLDFADSKSGKSKIPMEELKKKDFEIHEGNNRHEALLRVMESRIIKLRDDEVPLEEIRELCIIWNQQHCKPPLDDKMFERQWKDAQNFIKRKDREREGEREEGKEEQQQEEGQKQQQEQEEPERIGRGNKKDDAPPHSEKIIRETSEHVKAKYKIITVEESGAMLYYRGGVYVPGAETIIKKEAQAMFQYDMRNQLINEIIGAVTRGTFVSDQDFDTDLNIVNFADCLYNVKTQEVLEHRPEYLSRNQKPVKLLLARQEQHKRANNGSIYPRLYGRFLSEILYSQQRRSMVELFAYTYYRSNPHELYVNQWGFGGNGKGVNMAILKASHGLKNVSNIPLRKLVTDRFAPADLTYKDVNVDDDTSSGTVTDNSILKKITGNQPTWVQRKNKDAYETILHAKFWFTCNQLPDIIDESDGRYRREITIIYPNTFVKNPTRAGECKEDPDIEDKIVKDELEMSRIANMCMDVLHRILYKQNKRVYSDIATINERKKHLQIIKSPISEFVQQVVEFVFIDSDKHTLYKDELYSQYLKFCKIYNIPPKDTIRFAEELLRVFGGKERLKDKRDSEATLGPGATKKTRRRLWIGLRLRDRWVKKQVGIQKNLLGQEGEEDDDDNEDNEESK